MHDRFDMPLHYKKFSLLGGIGRIQGLALRKRPPLLVSAVLLTPHHITAHVSHTIISKQVGGRRGEEGGEERMEKGRRGGRGRGKDEGGGMMEKGGRRTREGKKMREREGRKEERMREERGNTAA